MRPGARRARVLATLIALAMGACASVSDVRERAAALTPRIDPATRGANGYCPPRELAFAAAELAFAQAAADRADPGAAARHLCAAQYWTRAAQAKTSACAVIAPIPPEPAEPAEPSDLSDLIRPSAPGESP